MMAEQKDKFKIDKLFAFIADDTSGEGVAAFHDNTLGMVPMVGADMKRVESLRGMAQMIADQTGNSIKVCEFSVRTELEVIKPK